MSFCGPNPTPEQFEESQIAYNDFIVNPQIIFDPKLVIRIEGKYYTWKAAAPILVSFFFFNKTLPQVYLIYSKFIIYFFYFFNTNRIISFKIIKSTNDID